MNYRVWNAKPMNRAAAVTLARQIATADVQKQIDMLLERHPDADIPESEKKRAFDEALKKSTLLAGVLVAREIEDKTLLSELLGDGEPLSDPFLLKDMDRAVARITRAIDEEETIVVFGDYDVDGVTATALLYQHLKGMGANVKCMLPNRESDGYGLSRGVVQSIYEKGYRLIVTVDNGVSAVEEAALAASLGMELVITDHHLPPETLPQAAAIVNPRRVDDESPFKGLSGAGVAFKLCAALDGCSPEEMLDYCGDLAAIGTVADVMPLTGENRTLVQAGLEAMGHSERTGLNALFAQAGLENKSITAENISYAIAPRINAAGRMSSAVTALQLVLSEDEVRAAQLAEQLNDANLTRQKAEQEIMAVVQEQLEEDPTLLEQRVVVVAGKNWHVGVIGIVASRLVERTGRPAIVISIDEHGEGKGSGRSIDGFHLHACLGAQSDLLIRYGGHAMAAGLSVAQENIAALRKAINEWAIREYPVVERLPIEPDVVLQLDRLDLNAVAGLERLAPFGTGNATPLFLLENATIDGVYPVSEGRHCRLRLRQGKSVFYAAYFGMPIAEFAYQVGDSVETILTLNVYEGKNGAQLSGRVQDIRPAGITNEVAKQSVIAEALCNGATLPKDLVERVMPTRADVTALYRLLQGQIYHAQDLQPLLMKLGSACAGKTLISLAALKELGFVEVKEQDGAQWLCVRKDAPKKSLAEAPILKRMERMCNG